MPSPPSFTPDFYEKHWAAVNKKYDILAEHSKADLLRAQTDASSLPGYREALGFHARAAGQQALEGAATEVARRYLDPEWIRATGRKMVEEGVMPSFAQPGAPGAGAPGAGVPGAGAPPPIQFQTLPGQSSYPAASQTSAEVSQPSSPESIENMTPEELAEWTRTAATPQGVQGPTAPTGPAAQRRLAEAQARQPALPSLLRPTPVTTSKVPAMSPLYSTDFRTGFRRGTANVKPRGYAKGDEDISDPLRGFVNPTPVNVAPGMSLARPSSQAQVSIGPLVPAPPPALGTPGYTPSAPGFVPGSTLPVPTPSFTPTSLPVGAPAPKANLESFGGIFDAAARVVNPERFNAALQGFNPSTNIENRLGVPSTPTSLGGMHLQEMGNRIAEIGNLINPIPLASAIGTAIFGDRAAPGSMPAQLGMNNLGTTGGVLGSLSNILGGGSAPPATAPAAPAAAASSPPQQSVQSTSEKYRKGTANVKGKGGKNGKASKAGNSPKGLEALLPLLAAMQGGGAPGPAGPPAGPSPMPSGAGLKKGSANVKSKGGKSKSGDQPAGLEALLSALAGVGGAAGPQASAAGVPMAPSAAAPPGFAYGMSDVQMAPPTLPALMPMVVPRPIDTGYAAGTPSVQPMPNYPFGAGYLFGASAVPGEGTGKTDTVPAMLAPHEAVLNRAAADMLGRGLIAALNQRGVKAMQMNRGVA